MYATNDVFNYVDCDRYSGALQKGVTFLTTLYVYQSCDNLPNNLTGYTAKLVVKDQPGALTSIFECTELNGRASIEPTKGLVHFQVSAADSLLFEAGNYVFEATVTSADDLVYRLAFGRFQILESI